MFTDEFFLVLIPGIIPSWYKYEKLSLVSYAGDTVNFTTVIKTFDHSEMREMNGDKIEKFQQKLSEPTDDAKVDTPRAQFLDLIQQLKDAYANGDTETAQAIRDQLDELRQTVFLNMRNSQY